MSFYFSFVYSSSISSLLLLFERFFSNESHTHTFCSLQFLFNIPGNMFSKFRLRHYHCRRRCSFIATVVVHHTPHQRYLHTTIYKNEMNEMAVKDIFGFFIRRKKITHKQINAPSLPSLMMMMMIIWMNILIIIKQQNFAASFFLFRLVFLTSK